MAVGTRFGTRTLYAETYSDAPVRGSWEGAHQESDVAQWIQRVFCYFFGSIELGIYDSAQWLDTCCLGKWAVWYLRGMGQRWGSFPRREQAMGSREQI